MRQVKRGKDRPANLSILFFRIAIVIGQLKVSDLKTASDALDVSNAEATFMLFTAVLLSILCLTYWYSSGM